MQQTQLSQIRPVVMAEEPLEAVRIKRIGVLSVAGIFSGVLFFFGLIFGVVFAVFFAINSGVDMSFLGDSLGMMISNIGVWFALAIPFVLLIFGFVLGAFVAVFYNISVKMFKGIKLFS